MGWMEADFTGWRYERDCLEQLLSTLRTYPNYVGAVFVKWRVEV